MCVFDGEGEVLGFRGGRFVFEGGKGKQEDPAYTLGFWGEGVRSERLAHFTLTLKA